MITNKDRENAVSMTKIWIRDSEGNQLEDIAGIIARIRAESAEQARKEAADRAVSWVNANLRDKHEPIMSKKLEEDELRAAILGDSAPVSTDSEKLAIAVKALEEINHKRDDQPDCNLSVDYLDAWDISDRALKEIQG